MNFYKLKPIEAIQIGDMVWSRHEETLEFGYRPVTATVSFEDKQIYEVVVTNKDGKIETYQTTEEHPFWIHEFGWLPASSLIAGMTLVDRNDDTLTVISQSKLDKTDTVYNFTVDEFHTYHIGELGVWVHNACDIDLSKATSHGAERISERGFSSEIVNNIVNNYSEKGYQPGGLTVFIKKQPNRKYDVIILNKDNQVVSAIGGTKESLPNRKAVMRMLNNHGGFSDIPID